MKTAVVVFRALAWTGALAMAPVPAGAEHAHMASHYAHARSAEIPSLSPDEVRELREGEGMGLARAAELNHFPGPKHLLELAPDLDLGTAQVERIQAIFDKMKAEAVAKGAAILTAELHLSELFASGDPPAGAVRRMTRHIGTLRGDLQAVHLLAHIEATRELTTGQIEAYDRLRGYAD